jgi:hypothetical protein
MIASSAAAGRGRVAGLGSARRLIRTSREGIGCLRSRKESCAGTAVGGVVAAEALVNGELPTAVGSSDPFVSTAGAAG